MQDMHSYLVTYVMLPDASNPLRIEIYITKSTYNVLVFCQTFFLSFIMGLHFDDGMQFWFPPTSSRDHKYPPTYLPTYQPIPVGILPCTEWSVWRTGFVCCFRSSSSLEWISELTLEQAVVFDTGNWPFYNAPLLSQQDL